MMRCAVGYLACLESLKHALRAGSAAHHRVQPLRDHRRLERPAVLGAREQIRGTTHRASNLLSRLERDSGEELGGGGGGTPEIGDRVAVAEVDLHLDRALLVARLHHEDMLRVESAWALARLAETGLGHGPAGGDDKVERLVVALVPARRRS